MRKTEHSITSEVRISNRTKLRIIKQLLSDLITETSDIVFIDDKEHIDVYNLVDKWIDKHNE